jgi:O-antigen ligase
MLEIERDLLYVAAVVALALVVRRGSEHQLVAGIAVGTAAVVVGALGYYLLARNEVDVTQGYLFFRPVGYANALGGLIAMGIPLLLGLSIADGRRGIQAAAAALAVVLLVALYLTQNRSGWLALAAALVVWLLTTSTVSDAAAAIVLAAIPAAAAIAVVSRLDLISTDAAGGRAGRTNLAAAVVVGFAGLAAACALLRPHVRPGRRVAVRAAQGGALAVSAALAAAAAHAGDRAHYWRAAVHGIEHNWLLGSGAGTFDEVWFRYRDVGRVVRDAHSLYLESFTELGVVGLLLIVIVLSIPLVARGGSREPVLAAARGAYCAFLVHAAFEWDWEMPIVTLPALALAIALLLSRRDSVVIRVAPAVRLTGATAVALLMLFAVDALAGNAYVVAAEHRAQAGDDAAAEARAVRATRLLPWASEPWLVIADLHARAGDAAGSRDALRNAVSRDRSDWLMWYRLAAASSGRERAAAVRRLALLNPRLVRRP